MEYRVIWTIDLDAESPEDAALKALAIQRDEASLAGHFLVEDAAGHRAEIETGAIPLDLNGEGDPPGLQELMGLLQDVAAPESNGSTPVHVTVESHQGIIVGVNAFQDRVGAYRAEEDWLVSMNFSDRISRELHEDQGTAFHVFAANLLPCQTPPAREKEEGCVRDCTD